MALLRPRGPGRTGGCGMTRSSSTHRLDFFAGLGGGSSQGWGAQFIGSGTTEKFLCLNTQS